MRPLTLKLAGLRSYLAEQRIDFDHDLMAIVGDTGAGKSSILEALCVALYGSCTWSAKKIKPLISDGADTLQVSLTFRAEGKMWEVERATSRNNYPPAIHKLICIDDGTTIDGAEAVNEAIQKLVGLSYDAFLRAVILPQGRFQLLLQATDADRTAILKGIFRLDQLAQVREIAAETGRRLRPNLGTLRERRATLLPNPAATADEAEHRQQAAAARANALQSARTAMEAARQRCREAEQQARNLGEACGRIEEARLPNAAAALEALAASEGEIDAARKILLPQRDTARADEEKHAAALAAADAASLGAAGLASAASTIEGLLGQLETLAADETRLATAGAAIDAESAALVAQEKEALAKSVAAQVAEAVATLHAAASAETRQREHLTSIEETLAARQQDQEKAAAARQKAAQAWQEADAAFTAARRAEAAAFAAQQAAPGEPCPICTRPLPDDFAPAAAPRLDTAHRRLKEAEGAARLADKRLTTAEADRRNTATRQDEAQAQLAALQADRRQAAAALPADAAVDGAALAAVPATEAEAAHGRAITAARQARDRAARTTADHQASRDALARRRDALIADREALATRRRGAEARATALPEPLRPTLPLTRQLLTASRETIASRRQAIDALASQRTTAQKTLDGIHQQLEALVARRREEVESPVQRLSRQLSALTARVDDAATSLQLPAPPAPPEEDGAAILAIWATDLDASASAVIEQGRAAEAAQREAAAAAQREVEHALAGLGLADENALGEALGEAAATARQAAVERDKARAQENEAADLDHRIKGAAPFLDTLDEIARLLADGKFIGHVVNRKQRALLAVASELLADMTGKRFGFAEDFQLVDRLSGQPRSVKTLSGGETFLASLSLALALVELADRGGGRLEALFLDEGFGSLDANALLDALDALGEQAEKGRLVAVISHLRAVAENVEHVLHVSKGPNGSEVRWLDGAARETLIAEEVGSGLLA